MKESLKKYWFLVLLAVVLVVAIGYFAYDQTKGILPGKKVDGKDVVYSIGETDVTADAFYDELYENLGAAGVFQYVQKIVVNSVIETTDEMKEIASTNKDTVIAQFQSSYGTEYEATLLQAIQAVGYNSIDDLETYFIDSQKYEAYAKQLIETGYDEALQPRILSHILVTMADPANPTEEELAKVAEIDAALEAGDDFGEVAATYSDDSSATSNGLLGYSDSTTSYVPEFLAASLELQEGQVSEWVQTQYGYHKILCNAATLETLKTYDEFYDGINAANPTIVAQGIWDKAQELGITFGSEDVEAKLLAYLGLEGGEE